MTYADLLAEIAEAFELSLGEGVGPLDDYGQIDIDELTASLCTEDSDLLRLQIAGLMFIAVEHSRIITRDELMTIGDALVAGWPYPNFQVLLPSQRAVALKVLDFHHLADHISMLSDIV